MVPGLGWLLRPTALQSGLPLVDWDPANVGVTPFLEQPHCGMEPSRFRLGTVKARVADRLRSTGI